jgi:hypothetical protein
MLSGRYSWIGFKHFPKRLEKDSGIHQAIYNMDGKGLIMEGCSEIYEVVVHKISKGSSVHFSDRTSRGDFLQTMIIFPG